MPTFINEAVLSLPEQVEKNKEDIKAIEETIGGIDPDLINQVQTNTNDISAIKQEQIVQNTAINNNTNKTQNINTEGTQYGNVEKVANANGVMEITADGLTLESTDVLDIITPNANINVSNSGVVKISNDNNTNKLEYDAVNGDFKVSGDHTLEFDSATGDLKIDGGAVGGGGYIHNISFYTANGNWKLSAISSDNTAVTDTASLINLLKKYGFDTESESYGCIFAIGNSTMWGTPNLQTGFVCYNEQFQDLYFRLSNGVGGRQSIGAMTSITDNVIEL